MACSNKERIKEQLFREALFGGRVRPCDGCNDYFLRESLNEAGRCGDLLCPHCRKGGRS